MAYLNIFDFVLRMQTQLSLWLCKDRMAHSRYLILLQCPPHAPHGCRPFPCQHMVWTGWLNSHDPSRTPARMKRWSTVPQPGALLLLIRQWLVSPFQQDKTFLGRLSSVCYLDNWSTPFQKWEPPPWSATPQVLFPSSM